MTEYIEHITREGDRWDLLAWEYYGDALGYERIIAANPHVAIVPVLAAGIRLLIPVVEEADDTVGSGGNPPWL